MALASLFRKNPKLNPVPLYMALVGWARDSRFYTQYQVSDSVDGRFDMMALVISLALLRLERDGEAHRAFGQALMETFITDMDESMREAGAGDLGVGKQVRRMAEAFVGRYGAYRAAAQANGNWGEALARNLYRDQAIDSLPMAARVAALRQQLDGLPDEALLTGEIGELP